MGSIPSRFLISGECVCLCRAGLVGGAIGPGVALIRSGPHCFRAGRVVPRRGFAARVAIGCGLPPAVGATHGEAYNRRCAPWHEPKLPWSPWPCAENEGGGPPALLVWSCDRARATSREEQPRSAVIASVSAQLDDHRRQHKQEDSQAVYLPYRHPYKRKADKAPALRPSAAAEHGGQGRRGEGCDSPWRGRAGNPYKS